MASQPAAYSAAHNTFAVDDRNGFSLVEVMVATLILTILFLSSAQFFATPPDLVESRMHAALSQASGMLDVMFAESLRDAAQFTTNYYYVFRAATNSMPPRFESVSQPVYTNMVQQASIFYKLHITTNRVAEMMLYRQDSTNHYATLALRLPP